LVQFQKKKPQTEPNQLVREKIIQTNPKGTDLVWFLVFLVVSIFILDWFEFEHP